MIVWQPQDALAWRHIVKPYCDSEFKCGECGRPYREHGWIEHGVHPRSTGHLICPGTRLVRRADGEYEPAGDC